MTVTVMVLFAPPSVSSTPYPAVSTRSWFRLPLASAVMNGSSVRLAAVILADVPKMSGRSRRASFSMVRRPTPVRLGI